MKARFVKPAETELNEAYDYYEEQKTGLGPEFLLEVAATVQLIKKFPESWPLVSNIDRARRVKRFPFRIVYFVTGDEIVVLALAHFKRKLRY